MSCYQFFASDKEMPEFDNGKAKPIIADYLKALLADRFTVSLFNTWTDDESELCVKKVDVADLSIEDIKGIWGRSFWRRMSVL